MSLITIGAEARILKVNFLGREAIRKERVPKRYRIPEVDLEIRKKRTLHEARIMKRLRTLGIPTPIIYDVDLRSCSITMEYVEGTPLKEFVIRGEKGILRKLGRLIGRMHKNGIIHGDLTPLNVIVSKDGRIVLLDFGLSEFSEEELMMGIDLRVLKESIKALRDDYEELFSEFLEGYKEEFERWRSSLEKMLEIEKMGRYVTG